MKNKIMTYLFMFILFSFMILSFIFKDNLVSVSERRKLATFPSFSWQTILDNSYFSELNSYLVDQFPFRNSFRKIKAIFASSILKQKESHGVLEKDGYLFQINASINEKSVSYFLQKINGVNREYLKNQNIYFAMIPDKNYYLTDDSIPKLDYLKLENELKENLDHNIKWIDLKNNLSLDSYYLTDIHWKQESLEPVLKCLQENMKLDNTTFPTKEYTYSNFYGALYSRGSFHVSIDSLTYLTNNTIQNANVYNYEKKENQVVYNPDYLKHMDSYDVFLSGATPLLTITNKEATTDRELILFRDSFGSSIAPLIIENYQKITMIDLRYIGSKYLASINDIDFTDNSDVLFLYSVPIINNSFTLK